MVIWSTIVVVIQFLLFWECQTFLAPLVETLSGTVRGTTDTSSNGKTFFVFRGIPYAQPPIENLRFQAPQEVKPWTGVFNATKEAVCIQVWTSISPLETEDCLTLNIYSPQIPEETHNESLLPVMFYIFGGGFYIGNATYERNGPHFLIDHDVVIVTVNYRLGAFGFLSTQDVVIPGNAALKDQLLGLKWIQKNIAKFGGNPKKVTIFGHSAGGACVGYHILSSSSKGLFRAAILQSGNALAPWAHQKNPKQVAYRTATAISYNGTNNSLEILKFLQKASASDIRQASIKVLSENDINLQQVNGYMYAPVLEVQSENAFLTEQMYKLFAAGKYIRVPTIIGVTSAENIGRIADLTGYKESLKNLGDHIELLVPDDIDYDPHNRRNLGELIKNIYAPNITFKDNFNSGIMYYDDHTLCKPSRKQAELQSEFSEVYFYQFSYAGQISVTELRVNLTDYGNVGHGEECLYMWKSQTPSYSNLDLSKFSTKDILTQKRLLLMWTNFAKFLNPTVTALDVLQNVKWPLFSKNNTIFLDINENLVLKTDLRDKRYNQWNDIYHKYGSRNFYTY